MEIKQGSTFLLALQVEVDGKPQSLVGWTVTSSIGTKNRSFVQPMKVVVIDADKGLVEISAQTDAWPLGQMYFDIKYVTDSAQKVVSESVSVLVTQSITK